jgi:hypothetical protein
VVALLERMLLSQISQRMLEATLILIESYTPLFYLIDVFKKFSGVVDLDQWSKSIHAIFSNDPRRFLSPPCFSLSPQTSLSLCLPLPLSCLIPHHVLRVLISLKYFMIAMHDY